MNKDQFNLRNKLEPAILAFTKSLDCIKNDIIDNRNETDKQLKIVQQQNATLKERINEANRSIKYNNEKVGSEVAKCKELQAELQTEINKNQSENESIKKTRVKIEQSLKATESEKDLIEQHRMRLDDAVNKYNEKSNALLKDFNILSQKSEKLLSRIRASWC